MRNLSGTGGLVMRLARSKIWEAGRLFQPSPKQLDKWKFTEVSEQPVKPFCRGNVSRTVNTKSNFSSFKQTRKAVYYWYGFGCDMKDRGWFFRCRLCSHWPLFMLHRSSKEFGWFPELLLLSVVRYRSIRIWHLFGWFYTSCPWKPFKWPLKNALDALMVFNLSIVMRNTYP